jgi:GrpB-like predicted nucleotidyltransferase (UPF0157 family)/SAM-dependent methyltransferase
VSRRVIEVVDPDPSWADRFEAERVRLERALRDAGVDDEVVAIEHVGSTAVDGLAAKPVIDISIGLRRWPASEAFIAALEDLGYHHRGESEIAGRHYLTDGPSGGDRTRQIHVVTHGSRFWVDHLLFRDHLRTHPGDAARYARAKRQAARDHRHDVIGYMEAKHEVVRDILRRARREAGLDRVHCAAAEGFDTDAERYDRARPGYPDEAVAWLVDALDLGPGATVADLGAGTGKLTGALADATPARVVAVEPVADMRRVLAERLPGIEVLDGTAEDLPLARRSVDALVAGQAFHWFEPFAAFTEAYYALREDGGIGLIWNVRDESVGWVARWTEIVEQVSDGAPRERIAAWRDALAVTELFDGPESATFANPHPVPRELVVERVASTSFFAALDDDRREELLAEFRDLLDTDPGTQGRERISVPYRTEVHVLRRAP